VAQNIALHSRPLSPLSRPPLNVATGVIPFTTPGVVLSVVGGLHARVASRLTSIALVEWLLARLAEGRAV
jgi:hypothetical protein